MKWNPEAVELDEADLQSKLDRIESVMGMEMAQPFRLLLGWYACLLELLREKKLSLRRLQRILFGAATERLRCGDCGEIFTAELPEEAGPDKYDASVAATIATLRYGEGMPWNRLQRLQQSAGIPLPASDPWELVRDAAEQGPRDAHRHLVDLAAQGDLLHHDDTTMRVLELTRLRLHQQQSKPVMDELHRWLKARLDEKLVEPNSSLGAAISYLLNHWPALTLFLRVPGAPLDNNVCERALKMAIRHRKNSLFYKTQRGADVGDLYMSLIYTCYSSGASPVDYLTELQRNHDRVRAAPGDWMPWNYRGQLVSAKSEADGGRGPPCEGALPCVRSPCD
jgi:hypothetical protein